jgi:hypothetical protein
MKKLLFTIFFIASLLVSHAFAASKATCPDKVLSTDTITGIYMGWFEAEEGFHSIGIKIDGDEQPVYIVASEEDAQKYFRDATDKKIQVTYITEQFWLEEGNECVRFESLKSGKVLADVTVTERGNAQNKSKNSAAIPTGKYIYMEKGYAGELELSSAANNTYKIALQTVSQSSADSCEFKGQCVLNGNILICKEVGGDEDAQLSLDFTKSGLNVTKFPFSYCGMRGYMGGFYKKK